MMLFDLLDVVVAMVLLLMAWHGGSVKVRIGERWAEWTLYGAKRFFRRGKSD